MMFSICAGLSEGDAIVESVFAEAVDCCARASGPARAVTNIANSASLNGMTTTLIFSNIRMCVSNSLEIVRRIISPQTFQIVKSSDDLESGLVAHRRAFDQ